MSLVTKRLRVVGAVAGAVLVAILPFGTLGLVAWALWVRRRRRQSRPPDHLSAVPDLPVETATVSHSSSPSLTWAELAWIERIAAEQRDADPDEHLELDGERYEG